MLFEKEMISPKTQTIDDWFGLIEYYLKPLTDYINKLTEEQRKDLRSYFGGGADTRFWRTFQNAIAKERLDFNPIGLKEYWQDENKEYNNETQICLNDIEKRAKDIISGKLEELYGDAWLIKGVPKSVYTKAKKIADDKIYKNITNNCDETEISAWDFVDMSDCKQIVLYGKNWSSVFDEIFTRPDDEKISGGKDVKTEWLNRLNILNNKLMKDSFSVSYNDYNYVKSIYEHSCNEQI